MKFQKVKKEFSNKLHEKDLKIQELTKQLESQLMEKDDQIQKLRKELDDKLKQTKSKIIQLVDETKTKQEIALNESVEKLSVRLDATNKSTHEFINAQFLQRSNLVTNLNKKLAEKNQLTSQILSIPQCPYTFNIENFKTQFEEAKRTNKMICSPNFLTENGYLGRLDIFLNGDKSGKDTHISAYFRNLKGPYDDMLKWPMPRKSDSFRILVNGKEVIRIPYIASGFERIWKNHFTRPTGNEGERLGYTELFEHGSVENLSNDDVFAVKYAL